MSLAHSVIIEGYKQAKYDNIHIASFNKDNTLNVSMMREENESRVHPRVNIKSLEHFVVVFFE